jgi:hypothetical protein
MTPEQQNALSAHLQAIAKILYEESDSSAISNLEEIEVAVRHQIQQHISPELGHFLSSKLPKPAPGKSAP